MKVTEKGLDCLVTYLLKSYRDKNPITETEDEMFESVLSFVMNEQDLVDLNPETDLETLHYITNAICNEL